MAHSPDPKTLDHWLDTAVEAAAAAAAVHSAGRGRVDIHGADSKGFSDFVSQVDLESQEAALEIIARRHPDHLILAEEDDTEQGLPEDDTPIWVVDPLDGTTNYLHGHPNFAASIALAVSGRPVASCVHAAATSERWYGRAGGGAFRNGRPIQTSRPRGWEKALVATGFTFNGDANLDVFTRRMAAVRAAGSGIRRGGSAALDLCYVADGRFEGFWEHHLNPWDYAAGWILVEEAGGVTGRVEELPLGLEAGSILAVNHPDTLPRLRKVLDLG